MLWARGMSNKTKDKIVFRDLARKFEWFTDEIGDMEVQSIIIPDDLPKIIEVFARYYFNFDCMIKEINSFISFRGLEVKEIFFRTTTLEEASDD